MIIVYINNINSIQVTRIVPEDHGSWALPLYFSLHYNICEKTLFEMGEG